MPEVEIECTSINPDTGQQCTMGNIDHELHAARGSTWTDRDVADAKDPQKVLIKTIQANTAALNRIANSLEHYMLERLHKVQ